jgi:hypothetical protein
MYLLGFDFMIKYYSGKTNPANVLSWRPDYLMAEKPMNLSWILTLELKMAVAIWKGLQTLSKD